MGPPESVQTIIITFYQHGEEIFANLESLQASQAESSGSPTKWRSRLARQEIPGEISAWLAWTSILWVTQNQISTV